MTKFGKSIGVKQFSKTNIERATLLVLEAYRLGFTFYSGTEEAPNLIKLENHVLDLIFRSIEKTKL